PAAAPVHRARGGAQARRAAARRTDLRPRPDLHQPHRAADRGTQARLHDPDRDPQHAAGRARVRLHRLHVPRRPGRTRRDGYHLLQSLEAADRGLHHGAFRMNNQPHDHIVRSYDEEQQRLAGELLRMGEMAAAQLEAALDVVDRRDDNAARRVVDNDVAIDALEQETSQDVMKLTLRGPLARDLRQILAALRIASDIERIGDY